MQLSIDIVHPLVKSLNLNEVQRFKLYIRKSHKLQLAFDAFRQLETWDTGEWDKLVQDPTMINIRSHYAMGVFVQIMRFLVHSLQKGKTLYENVGRTECVILTEQIHILMERELYPLAKFLIPRAMEMARDLELWSTVGELHKLNLEVIARTWNGAELLEQEPVIHAQLQECHQHVIDIETLEFLRHKISLLRVLQGPERKTEAEQISKNPLLSKNWGNRSIKAQILFRICLFNLNLNLDKVREASDEIKPILELYDAHSGLLRDSREQGQYVRLLFNLGMLETHLENFESAKKIEKRLSRIDLDIVFPLLSQLRLSISIKSSDEESIERLRKEWHTESDPQKYPTIAKKHHHTLGYYYLWTGQFGKAKKCLYSNFQFQLDEDHPFENTLRVDRLLYCLASLEVDDFDFCNSSVRRINRELAATIKGISKVEKEILRIVNLASKHKGTEKEMEMYRAAQVFFENNYTDPKKFDFQLWAKSKLLKMTMFEISNIL